MDETCAFYLEKKGRRCRFAATSGSLFCGNHQKGRERVPCPLDPRHDVDAKDLKSHCAKCPTLRERLAKCDASHYRERINRCPTNENFDPPKCSSQPKARRQAYEALGNDGAVQLVRRVEAAWRQACGREPESSVVCREDVVQSRQGRANVKLGEKHVTQQVSIVGNVERWTGGATARQPGIQCIVEFGAGRGYLGSMAAEMLRPDRVLFVERNSYRFKAERELRQIPLLECKRAKVDIADFDLCSHEWFVPGGEKHHVIGLAKHLCGRATDLAIRCCLKTNRTWEADNTHVLRGFACATCCHHLTNWESYENKRYWIDLGLSSTEFEIVCWMTSWAICGSDHGRNGAVDGPGDVHGHVEMDRSPFDGFSSRSDRLDFGRKCKQLIDEGRIRLLRDAGYEADLLAYVPRSVTEENRLINARLLV